MTSLHFSEKLQPAIFWERPNRFLLRCSLEDGSNMRHDNSRANHDNSRANEDNHRNTNHPNPDSTPGQMVDVHLADPGRLKELLIPGKQIWLRPAQNPQRRTRWSAALIENPEGTALVSIDSTLPNRLVAKALYEDALPVFKDWNVERAEFKIGNSRFDFLLSKGHDQMALEVKSATLVKEGTALFPDAVTSRGAKHVHELAEIASRPGWSAGILFVVQREDASSVSAAADIDSHFASALADARQKGVQIAGIRCKVTQQAISLDKPIPVE